MHENTFAILKRGLSVITAVIILAGCTPLRINDDKYPHIEGLRFPVDAADQKFLDLANKNRCILQRDYSDERRYYPSSPPNTTQILRPKTGLALSGGGMRSAAFSIGVMTGLAKDKESGVFKTIDIVSAVSGGSYALSWYYLQQYYMENMACKEEQCPGFGKCEESSPCKACPAQLLEPEGPFQQRLARHGGLTGKTRGAVWMFFDLLFSPLNIITNGLFGMHTNTAISRDFYEQRIEQIFHRIPNDACGNKTNGYPLLPDVASNWFTMGIFGDHAKFHDLKPFIEKHKLPFFIVNATVQLDDDPWHRGAKLSNSVFEFTPLHLGSTGVGFANWKKEDDRNKSTMTVVQGSPKSGATVDSAAHPEASQNMPETAHASGAQGEQITRAGIYCNEIKRETPERVEADPMPMVQAVSISGAAVDSAVIPGSQQKVLMAMFNVDLGFYLSNYNNIPTPQDKTIHDILPFPFYFWHYYARDKHGVKLYLSDGGHSENLGAFSLVRRLPERIIIVDAEQDYDEEKHHRDHVCGYVFEAYRKLKAGLKAEMGVDFTVSKIDDLMKSRVSDPYNAKESCFDGKISYFPYVSEKGEPVRESIDVKYIKLSIDKDRLEKLDKADPDQYPESVRAYFKNSRKGENDTYCSRFLDKFDLGCTFPQEATTNQSYSEEQFNAYRDLGKWIVEKQCNLKNWIQSRQ